MVAVSPQTRGAPAPRPQVQEGGSSGSKDGQKAVSPSWELDEEVSDDDGIVLEESEETKRKVAAKEPSRKMRAEHEDENHAVFRS